MERVESKKRVQITLKHDDLCSRQAVYVRPRGSAIDAPPYKDIQGKWRTISLFVETFDQFKTDGDGDANYSKYTPIFTLREHPYNVPPSSMFYGRYETNLIPSIRETYLDFNDPTEYQFATTVFHSTYHWKHLCGLVWFKPYVEEWRRTLAQKLRGLGISKMVEVTGGSDPKFALMAGKWLAEGKFAEPELKGRPSKKEVAVELKLETGIERIYEDDAKRIGIEASPASVFIDLNNETKQ